MPSVRPAAISRLQTRARWKFIAARGTRWSTARSTSILRSIRVTRSWFPNAGSKFMGRPLRILQVMRAPVGGLFRHVADLTRGLAARGHSVGLVVDSLASDAQTEKRIEALRKFTALGVHAMPMPRLLGMGDLTTPL